MARRKQIAGDGNVLDYKMKGEQIVLALDASPDNFLTRCKNHELPVRVHITGGEDVEDVEFSGEIKAFKIELKEATIPAERLGDLRFLIQTKAEVHIRIIAPPEEGKLFQEEADSKAE